MTCLFVNDLALLLDKNFRSELHLVSILLLANIFMGLYSNISSWYKLSDQNHMMALVSISGMLLMIILNILLIPAYGNKAAAYANLTAYGFICGMAYVQGQKKFPIPYKLTQMCIWLISAVVLVYVLPLLYGFFKLDPLISSLISATVILLYGYAAYVWVYLRDRLTNVR